MVFVGGGKLDVDVFGGFVYGGDDVEIEFGFVFVYVVLVDDRKRYGVDEDGVV